MLLLKAHRFSNIPTQTSKPLLLNLADTLLEVFPSKSYHYDWFKKVEGINRNETTGYSLKGDFISHVDSLEYHRPGLYLVYAKRFVEVDGEKGYYHLCILFEINEEGLAILIQQGAYPKRDWAVHLWEAIDNWLLAHPKPPKKKRARKKAEQPTSANIEPVLLSEPGQHQPLQTPISTLIIRYAIEAQVERRDRIFPKEQIDLGKLPTKEFPWGKDYLLDKYLADLAYQLGVDRRLLPNVMIDEKFITFAFPKEDIDEYQNTCY